MRVGIKIVSTDIIIENFKKIGIDALIGIGGDGSLKILQSLTKKGNINFVGIPKTIDNDVKNNELSIGYDTAVDVATNALDMLQPTAASHRRVMILEVMGRDAGHIALNAGIAGGADIILIPEIKYSIDGIINKLNSIYSFIIGSILGLVSGIVGIGGGIFLSPILFLLKAEKPKVIATTASLFILINSISGILGQFTKENTFYELTKFCQLEGELLKVYSLPEGFFSYWEILDDFNICLLYTSPSPRD